MLKLISRILVTLFIAHLLSTGSLTAQTSRQAAIDSAVVLVESVQERHSTPGLAVSISKGGKMVWSEGFGFADIARGGG